ncbi:MAG: hypothetical protein SFU87_02380 [Chitinophagaceae bacterium]|nr:hypothetical protein [Chitinophagaceae bacterium]
MKRITAVLIASLLVSSLQKTFSHGYVAVRCSGFRRPGYIPSVEPDLSYLCKNITAFATVPLTVHNRTQSYSDKLRSADDGIKRQGDAAFADYAVNIGFSLLF